MLETHLITQRTQGVIQNLPSYWSTNRERQFELKRPIVGRAKQQTAVMGWWALANGEFQSKEGLRFSGALGNLKNGRQGWANRQGTGGGERHSAETILADDKGHSLEEKWMEIGHLKQNPSSGRSSSG